MQMVLLSAIVIGVPVLLVLAAGTALRALLAKVVTAAIGCGGREWSRGYRSNVKRSKIPLAPVDLNKS